MKQDEMDMKVLDAASSKGGAQRRVTVGPDEVGLSVGDLRRTFEGLKNSGDVTGDWVGQPLNRGYADLKLTVNGVRRLGG